MAEPRYVPGADGGEPAAGQAAGGESGREEFGHIEVITVTSREGLTIPEGKASTGKLILMRDSSKPDAGTLVFDENEWSAFIAGVKDGEFDLPDETG